LSSGIGFNELIVLFIIGLLILGPERLPRVATQIGRWVGRARRTANQLRYQLEREIALADIEKKSSQNKNSAEARKTADAAGVSETAKAATEETIAKPTPEQSTPAEPDQTAKSD